MEFKGRLIMHEVVVAVVVLGARNTNVRDHGHFSIIIKRSKHNIHSHNYEILQKKLSLDKRR